MAQFMRFAEYEGLLFLSCCDSTSARNAACSTHVRPQPSLLRELLSMTPGI